MKIFQCPQCNHSVYFENTQCLQCGSSFGFSEKHMEMFSVDKGKQAFKPAYKYCENFYLNACNWLLEKESPRTLCKACQLNHTIPDLRYSDNVKKWQKLEIAKHGLVYSLIKLNLRVEGQQYGGDKGLSFDFLSAKGAPVGKKITTGYLKGLITINLDEADSVHREYIREKLAEPYRTLIGHFRHEIGHYYWEKIILSDYSQLNRFRQLFGNDMLDYGQALKSYYARKDAFVWRDQFISDYASAHPLEDWAETWAHYLHLMDTLETAYFFGLSLQPKMVKGESMSMNAYFDPYSERNFETIINAWLPMTYAVNSINRSMGLPDLYPFVLSNTIMNKLKFIHESLLGFRFAN